MTETDSYVLACRESIRSAPDGPKKAGQQAHSIAAAMGCAKDDKGQFCGAQKDLIEGFVAKWAGEAGG